MNWRELKEVDINGEMYHIVPILVVKSEEDILDEDYERAILYEIINSLLIATAKHPVASNTTEEFVAYLSEQLYETLKRNGMLNSPSITIKD